MKFPSVFTASQIDVLTDLHERDSQERRDGIREASSLKALAPAVAQLLHLLVLHKGAKRIVEFGTSHGYSTIHLAAAADRTDGHVYTVDAMPHDPRPPQASGSQSRLFNLHSPTHRVAAQSN